MTSIGTILFYVGSFLLSYYIVKFTLTYFAVVKAERNLKIARIRIEYASGTVSYKNLPYLDEVMLSQLLTIAATKMNYREERDGSQKRIVPDQVKAITVVHDNWPRPSNGSNDE